MSISILNHRQLYRMLIKKHNPIFEEFKEYQETGIPIICNNQNLLPNNKHSITIENNESSNDSLDEKLNKIESQKCDNIKEKILKSCLSPVSVSDINFVKKKLKVKFMSIVNVILIPSRKEYIEAALNNLLWYSILDYKYFLEYEILRKYKKKIDLTGI